MIRIHTLKALKDNFIYVLESTAGDAAAVDPGDAAPVLQFLRHSGLRLTNILCTHHHWDHVNGVDELVRAYPCCEVAGSVYDRDQNRIPSGSAAVSERTGYSLFGRPVQVLEIPGHTLGHIAYYFPEEKALFCGDTLFSAGCGRLFEGTPAQMFASLQKLRRLPPDTRIYFGHEYTLKNLSFVSELDSRPQVTAYQTACEQRISSGQDTTPSLLSTEIEVNPFLRASDVDSFTRLRAARDHF